MASYENMRHQRILFDVDFSLTNKSWFWMMETTFIYFSYNLEKNSLQIRFELPFKSSSYFYFLWSTGDECNVIYTIKSNNCILKTNINYQHVCYRVYYLWSLVGWYSMVKKVAKSFWTVWMMKMYHLLYSGIELLCDTIVSVPVHTFSFGIC